MCADNLIVLHNSINYPIVLSLHFVDKRFNDKRTEQAIELNPDFIASGCPFCKTMMTDGIKNKSVGKVEVKDIAELIAEAKDL